jgi:very-short-patch-repair endonuclease
MQNYSQCSDSEKAKILHKYYVQENKSFQEIAEMYQTYPNKVRRDAKKLGIKIRSKSEAQKLALSTGKHKHPTKGTQRDEDTKDKIGKSVMNSWENMSKSELKRRSELAKLNWEKLSDDEKQIRFEKANVAVRESSKTGSKLEKFLLAGLLRNGYRVEPHKEQILSNTKLHIDLFLPQLSIAIEVDGPSHFEPVWGEEALQRAQDYDNKKTGLLIGKQIKLIRIKQKRDFSKSRANIIFGRVIEAIVDIQNQGQTYIEIGDE